MNFKRASGLLLHPTSLPGRFGIGDAGPEAYAFIDLLKEAGQSYWQVLPLGPTGYGDSPYQSFSAFAGNTLLISPEKLAEEGLLEAPEPPKFPTDRVDFGAVYEWKNALLANAAERFERQRPAALAAGFEDFAHVNSWWLDDYALFRAIKVLQGQRPWYEWPEPLKLREPGAIAAIRDQTAEAENREKFLQFIFYRQWNELKEYAAEAGVEFIGDVPIFVALDSADVWCNRDKFKLNKDGTPRVVAGVPPDYFSATGQLWGNPIYDWNAMREDGFSWWSARLEFTLRTVDIIRMDHFRGFAAAWEVPAGDKTAANGKWVDVPGTELFAALERDLGRLPLIAEDLGVITPDVEKLRDDLGLPGMRILQFAFGGDAKNHDLPHNYVANSVAYTGTHDNDTTVSWWSSTAGKGSTRDEKAISREREYALRYLNSDGGEIHWDMMRAVWASVANTAIAPVQDLLGLGSEARMNLPASESGNWAWRLEKDALTPEVVGRLRGMTETFGR
jgi:4-alpha-glucanotransferase